ncbi:MAG: deoxyribose-phosphate aldolase [Bacteroidia bacterium]|nr:deoxyribose-phosphate aldolase [Bacteroidia bacterium]
MIPDLKDIPNIDPLGVEERVTRFNTRSLKKGGKTNALKLALSMIDLTTLEGKDTDGKIRQLCYKAMHLSDELHLPSVAALCVYPNHVKTAKKALTNSGIKVASVATAFPSGNSSLEIKKQDVSFAVNEGADEIDMVISRGEFLKGNYNYVFDEIAAIKNICIQQRLKVILETGELGALDQVRKASEIAIQAGADFIKTSTGKIQPAATMPVTLVMLETIKDHYLKTGIKIGMKPAGGISNSKTALQYLVMLYETLGDEWMNSDYFRFGASSLANDIILQLGKEKHQAYFSKDYISID